MQKREGFVSRQDTAPKKGVSYRESCPHCPSLTPGAASQQGLGITPEPCPAGAGPSTQGIRSRARVNGEGKGFMAEGYQRHNIKTRQKEKKGKKNLPLSPQNNPPGRANVGSPPFPDPLQNTSLHQRGWPGSPLTHIGPCFTSDSN